MYHKMKARHYVEFSLKEFHRMFLQDKLYLKLYENWVKNNYDIQFIPSLDRADFKKPYLRNNVTMMTWAENRFKQIGELEQSRAREVYQIMGSKVIKV